jgi:hypothetical protein
MGRGKVEALIREILEDDYGIESKELTADMPLFSSGMLTSIDAIRIFHILGEKSAIGANVRFPTVSEVDTLLGLVDFVCSRMEKLKYT